jgi:hypothetical protein
MAVFEETESILPRVAFIALVAILIATDAFIGICTQIDEIGTDVWMFAVSTALFTIIILVFFFVKLRVSVDNSIITIRFIKKYEIPFTDIIDLKVGDIDIIRNYSGWGLKGVKFKNLICSGYERGISLKLLGKRVFTLSLNDPDALAALIPDNPE